MLIVTTLLVLASSAFGHEPKQPLVEKPPTITSGRLALVKANQAYPDAEAPLANTGNEVAAEIASDRVFSSTTTSRQTPSNSDKDASS